MKLAVRISPVFRVAFLYYFCIVFTNSSVFFFFLIHVLPVEVNEMEVVKNKNVVFWRHYV